MQMQVVACADCMRKNRGPWFSHPEARSYAPSFQLLWGPLFPLWGLKSAAMRHGLSDEVEATEAGYELSNFDALQDVNL